MPRPEPTRTRQRATAAPAIAAADNESTLRFGPLNAALMLAGLLSIIAGFVMLAGASTVGAPLLLVLGFAILVPLGIIL
ncbi:hypothetical protein [Longimicrobium terrae]|uniref:NADH:ubiquinone oxidoreductase subunit 6 (Subunit J) n=1 Tax=Longimicrobium terrae TaxID=1639882 RepID=A0A841H3P5_9BACT|nr:hypothetical protein [Longimicrobium terrae]MBB4638537.1 NADH:ubiquinone oxidoreductase subunit 6 (subunit J) [Longimicrobium terrae]MBB6072825.1 NADH:ubiquinone oxidoreductase subunit 6 (subunit J) [Longimicrobium terrae]NNC30558.1 hypothetical protein [Longimicrobium terrae]